MLGQSAAQSANNESYSGGFHLTLSLIFANQSKPELQTIFYWLMLIYKTFNFYDNRLKNIFSPYYNEYKYFFYLL
jgi:hypothetical protein